MVYESNYRPAPVVYDDELMHYGVKGMKWGVRRAQKYEAKAKRYRSRANETQNLVKKSKYSAKADKADVKAKLAKYGRDDLKKLRAANKLKGSYTDTQGLLRGPYADAVGSIRTQRGERYASALMNKHQGQQVMNFTLAMAAGTAAYGAGMAYLIGKM